MKMFVRRWWVFWLTGFMYAILGMFNSLNGAISQMTDDSWEKMFDGSVVNSRSFWILVSTVAIGTLQPLRALMNGDYQKAKGTSPDAKG